MNRPLSKDRLQTAFLLALSALVALFFVLLCCGNLGGQTDIVYLEGRDFMADMLQTEEYARALDPYGFGQGEAHVPFKDANYPPLAYVLFWLADAVSGRDAATPWALAVAILLGAAGIVLLWHALSRLLDAPRGKRALLAAALALSAPAVFAFERGNIILLAAVLCTWFLLGYQSPRRLVRELAFVALAVAAALKIYPALLGLLLLRQRRWKDALRLAAYGLCAVFLPFLCMQGGFANLPLLFENFGAHTAYYTRFIYPRFGFRLFASISYDTTFLDPFLNDNLWKLGDRLFRFMPAVDTLLACLCLAHACVCKRRWEAAAAILLVLVNYPVNSGYYTALYLLPAAALLLSCDALTRRDLWYAALLVLIFNPVQIPLPYALLGIADPILCNTTDILRNLAAYALFVLFAAKGAVGSVGLILTNFFANRPAVRHEPPPSVFKHE